MDTGDLQKELWMHLAQELEKPKEMAGSEEVLSQVLSCANAVIEPITDIMCELQ